MTQQNSTPTVAPVQTVAPVRTVQATTPSTVSENSSPVEIAPATAENLPVATTTAIPDPTPIPSSPTIAQPKLLTLGGNGKPDGHTKPDATVNPEQEAIQNTEYQPVAIKEDSRLTYSHDTLVCRNSKLTLFVNNAEQVYWSFGSDLASVDLIIEENTRVEAMVHTKDGKDTTIRVSITVCDCELFIPTAFTPNGDGLNDEWMVYAPAGITDFECMIYDKLGNIMFHTRNIHQGWNGTNNGNLLPAGGYFYSCRYRDELGQPHVQKGQLTLVR
ncbi:MAG: gliding motility-associated C-terminal domain-containing protein [Prevotella sp.]|nr:gliding motility-associated C-terminal domain-containing protein [Prevotella sp.]